MAAKVVTIVGDVTGPQQRHTHKIYLHLVNKIKGVSKYCNKSKTVSYTHLTLPTKRIV